MFKRRRTKRSRVAEKGGTPSPVKRPEESGVAGSDQVLLESEDGTKRRVSIDEAVREKKEAARKDTHEDFPKG